VLQIMDSEGSVSIVNSRSRSSDGGVINLGYPQLLLCLSLVLS
jgi:hypothetical protein